MRSETSEFAKLHPNTVELLKWMEKNHPAHFKEFMYKLDLARKLKSQEDISK